MQSHEIKKAVGPLRLIFWGGMICILDFSITDNATYKFDIISDVIGTIMITVGVFRLAEFEVHRRYSSAISFVKIIAILGIVAAIREHFLFQSPLPIVFVELLVGLASLGAVIALCVAMRWLSEDAGLGRAAQSWQTTMVLFVVLYALPMGLLYLVGAASLPGRLIISSWGRSWSCC